MKNVKLKMLIPDDFRWRHPGETLNKTQVEEVVAYLRKDHPQLAKGLEEESMDVGKYCAERLILGDSLVTVLSGSCFIGLVTSLLLVAKYLYEKESEKAKKEEVTADA